MKDKGLEIPKHEERELELIEALKDEYPDDYLTTLMFGTDYDEESGFHKETHHIGLFKCQKCGKPITHQQFAFAGVCGYCDTHYRPKEKWEIRKPPQKAEA